MMPAICASITIENVTITGGAHTRKTYLSAGRTEQRPSLWAKFSACGWDLWYQGRSSNACCSPRACSTRKVCISTALARAAGAIIAITCMQCTHTQLMCVINLPGQLRARDFALDEVVDVLRQLHVRRQPFGGLLDGPVVDFWSQPRFPQLLYWYVHVIVVMEGFLALLVARV